MESESSKILRATRKILQCRQSGKRSGKYLRTIGSGNANSLYLGAATAVIDNTIVMAVDIRSIQTKYADQEMQWQPKILC